LDLSSDSRPRFGSESLGAVGKVFLKDNPVRAIIYGKDSSGLSDLTFCPFSLKYKLAEFVRAAPFAAVICKSIASPPGQPLCAIYE
jgi:hypothetical protein